MQLPDSEPRPDASSVEVAVQRVEAMCVRRDVPQDARAATNCDVSPKPLTLNPRLPAPGPKVEPDTLNPMRPMP